MLVMKKCWTTQCSGEKLSSTWCRCARRQSKTCLSLRFEFKIWTIMTDMYEYESEEAARAECAPCGRPQVLDNILCDDCAKNSVDDMTRPLRQTFHVKERSRETGLL